jgi:RNA polymerase sigma-70 factor (ECF subfamily)
LRGEILYVGEAVMSTTPLEELLEKLSSGDMAAAEEVFRDYEPYLRLVVRRMLPESARRKLDSVDVVHSIWADLLSGFRDAGWRFTDAGHLRAFLVKATRNRFMDHLRRIKPALDSERPHHITDLNKPLTTPEPRPSVVAQAGELWDRMLALCDEAHRPLLLLKRQGFSMAEIARKTGYHHSSVRRIFYELSARLAAEGGADADSAPVQ